MNEEQLWSIPDDVESIYIHYTTEDLLKGFREEALRHRKEIERLKNELEVSRNNEETYRLEMLDITKRLGLDEETLFDDVKYKAERLNNIINELEDSIVGKINVLYQVRGQSNAIQELSILLRQLRELKGVDKE